MVIVIFFAIFSANEVKLNFFDSFMENKKNYLFP